MAPRAIKLTRLSVGLATLTAVLLLLLSRQSAGPILAQAQRGVAGRIAGKPDFSGIWQANNTANWDLLTHAARPMVPHPDFFRTR